MGMTFDYYDKGWFLERARIYQQFGERFPKSLDKVTFSFSNPKAGWMDMTVKVNDEIKLEVPISTCFNPFMDFSRWMQDIVKEAYQEQTVGFDYEGAGCYFHYEQLISPQIGAEVIYDENGNRTNEWRYFDANSRYEVGLFYIYNSGMDNIPVCAVCKTKDFINSFYTALLWHFANGNKNFEHEWFYGENADYKKPRYTNWTLYNWVKSPLLDWNYRTGRTYACDRPRFTKSPKIQSAIKLWPEYGDALFWSMDNKCCGSATEIWNANGVRVDLSSISGLREWYDKYGADVHPAYEWTEEEYVQWCKDGHQYLESIRKLLPSEIDLFVNLGQDPDDLPELIADPSRFIPRKRR